MLTYKADFAVNFYGPSARKYRSTDLLFTVFAAKDSHDAQRLLRRTLLRLKSLDQRPLFPNREPWFVCTFAMAECELRTMEVNNLAETHEKGQLSLPLALVQRTVPNSAG